jgi:hypothetical protein
MYTQRGVLVVDPRFGLRRCRPWSQGRWEVSHRRERI